MERLKSLDILRGITIAAMIIVNNPGSWAHMYSPLDHAEWNGVTPTDFIFPFFMFIMGVSMCFSLSKFEGRFSIDVLLKVVKRGLGLYLVGLLIVVLASLCRKGLVYWPNLRLSGVLARLAVSYVIGSMLVMSCRRLTRLWLIVFVLLAYAFLLLVGHGYDQTSDNILSQVDVALLGTHMYAYDPSNDFNFDPEGLLSTLPSVAHVLIGYEVGRLLKRELTINDKMLRLLLLGSAGMISAFLLQYFLPMNKRLWSPTYVLMTCGAACSLLAILMYIIDVKRYGRCIYFFDVIGVNPLFCFVLADIFAIGFPAIVVDSAVDGNVTLFGFLRDDVVYALFGSDKFGSLMYSVLILALTWVVALILYRRKIYIRL